MHITLFLPTPSSMQKFTCKDMDMFNARDTPSKKTYIIYLDPQETEPQYLY